MTLPPIGLARPELLWLLLIAPLVLALVVIADRARERAARTFAGAAALSARSRVRFWLRYALLVLGFASLVVALAGPYVDLRVRGARRLGVDLVLAIDISQSMATRDVEPDRLRAARRLAEDLGERLIGSRVSLVLFKGQGTTRYPATTDPKILGEVLDNSGKSGVRLQEGSSLAAAVESSLAAFPLDADAKRGRGIVIVSDGEVTFGAAPDLDTLVARGIKLFTVGVGTTKGGQIPTYDTKDGKFTGYLRGPDGVAIVSKLDENGLQKLASSAGGRYFHYAGEESVVSDLAKELRTLEVIESVDDAGSIPDERSQIFVAIAVAAVLVERFLSDRRRMPAPRHERRPSGTRRGRRLLGIAIGSALLWSVACGESGPSVERANGAFAAGDYARALAMYRDLQQAYPDAPQLSINAGNALHMQADYVRALPDYAKAIDVGSIELRAIAQYDRGNTLYRQGRLEDARDAYREALRLDPDDRQAKFNLELVQRLLDLRRTGQNPQPGQPNAGASGSPGGRGASGASGPRATGSPEPGNQQGTPSGEQGDPTSDRAPGQSAPEDLRAALSDFRIGLTIDDALRVLDALQGQQRGVAQLIEGPRRGNTQIPEY